MAWQPSSGFATRCQKLSARRSSGGARRRDGRWCPSKWQRELPDSEAPGAGALPEDIPYGLRISRDCMRLEIDPYENEILLRMMDLLGQDFSYASIVSDLNEKGFRTRGGHPWTRVTVFNMMPRLIEVGPRIFSSDEWEKRRRSMAHRSEPEAE